MPTSPPTEIVPVGHLDERSGLTGLHAAIEAADAHREHLARIRDVDALAIGLVELRAIRQHFTDLIGNVEANVADLMPSKRYEVPGVGVFERRKGTDRKAWRWDEVLNDVLPRLLAKHEGSYLDAVGELMGTVVPLTASNGPRVKPLRDLGLDPDEYAETKPGKVSVQIHGAS